MTYVWTVETTLSMETNLELEQIRSVLLHKYEQQVIETSQNYCYEEQYDLTNIFEDISDINDSCIYEYIQNKFKWNDEQTNTFIDQLKHPNTNKLQNNKKESNVLGFISNKLSIRYSTNIIKIFCDFCQDQEVYIL